MYMYRVKLNGTVMAYFLIYEDVDNYIENLVKIGYKKENFAIDELIVKEGELKHE